MVVARAKACDVVETKHGARGRTGSILYFASNLNIRSHPFASGAGWIRNGLHLRIVQCDQCRLEPKNQRRANQVAFPAPSTPHSIPVPENMQWTQQQHGVIVERWLTFAWLPPRGRVRPVGHRSLAKCRRKTLGPWSIDFSYPCSACPHPIRHRLENVVVRSHVSKTAKS